MQKVIIIIIMQGWDEPGLPDVSEEWDYLHEWAREVIPAVYAYEDAMRLAIATDPTRTDVVNQLVPGHNWRVQHYHDIDSVLNSLENLWRGGF